MRVREPFVLWLKLKWVSKKKEGSKAGETEVRVFCWAGRKCLNKCLVDREKVHLLASSPDGCCNNHERSSFASINRLPWWRQWIWNHSREPCWKPPPPKKPDTTETRVDLHSSFVVLWLPANVGLTS